MKRFIFIIIVLISVGIYGQVGVCECLGKREIKYELDSRSVKGGEEFIERELRKIEAGFGGRLLFIRGERESGMGYILFRVSSKYVEKGHHTGDILFSEVYVPLLDGVLFRHELGHYFGLGHDYGDVSPIMRPVVYAGMDFRGRDYDKMYDNYCKYFEELRIRGEKLREANAEYNKKRAERVKELEDKMEHVINW